MGGNTYFTVRVLYQMSNHLKQKPAIKRRLSTRIFVKKYLQPASFSKVKTIQRKIWLLRLFVAGSILQTGKTGWKINHVSERYSSNKQGKTQLFKTYPNQTHGGKSV